MCLRLGFIIIIVIVQPEIYDCPVCSSIKQMFIWDSGSSLVYMRFFLEIAGSAPAENTQSRRAENEGS